MWEINSIHMFHTIDTSFWQINWFKFPTLLFDVHVQPRIYFHKPLSGQRWISGEIKLYSFLEYTSSKSISQQRHGNYPAKARNQGSCSYFLDFDEIRSSTISSPMDNAVALTDRHTLSRGNNTLWSSAFLTLAISYIDFNPIWKPESKRHQRMEIYYIRLHIPIKFDKSGPTRMYCEIYIASWCAHISGTV